jgi:glycosyltransferase involved in cell wall biosynthesis
MESKPVMLQIVQHLKPGGIETMVLDLQRFLSDFDVHIVSIEGDRETALAGWERLRGVSDRLHFLNKPPGFQLSTMKQLATLMRDMRAEWIHTHHIGPLMYGGLAARMAGHLPLIHTEHDAWHLERAKNRRMQRALIWLTKPTLVADAQLVANNCKRFLPGSQYHLIPNGIDTDRFQAGDREAARLQFGLPTDTPLVGCAARLETVKGVDQLIEAIAKTPNHIHVALAGQGSQRAALEQRATNLGIMDRVHFLGGVNDMPAFYRSLDLFCLASHQEGLPLSPLEAQSTGVPCVLTDVGGSKEAVCPKTGTLVSDGDIDGLARAITDTLKNERTESPREFVLEHGNVVRMTAAYLALKNTAYGQGKHA